MDNNESWKKSDKNESEEKSLNDAYEEFFDKISLIVLSPYFAIVLNLILFPAMLMILPGLFEDEANIYLNPRSKFYMLVMNLSILFFALLAFLEIINKGIYLFFSKRNIGVRLLVTLGSQRLMIYLACFMFLFNNLKFIAGLQAGRISETSYVVPLLSLLFVLFVFTFLWYPMINKYTPFHDLIRKLKRKNWKLKR